MRRWTYKTIELKPSFFGGPPKDLEQTLGQAGTQGWELVNMLQTRPRMMYLLLFKREA